MTRTPMDEAQRWSRIEQLFHQAAAQPPESVNAFLDRACEGDPDLKERVLALLRADRDADGFLETPAARVQPVLPATDQPTVLGPFRLVRPLGEGGMGEVWLGIEEGPDFQRHAAIKVVRRGVDPGFDERFSRERTILAQLRHPGIARFLGGGTTAEGRPWYAMEYVEGERIDRHADRKRLTVRQRVELFRQVCLAVQHAHANLVVHRDLKPDNILVTADGVPKLLDFGIAKLLTDERPDLTRTGSRLATPAYAAPEQLMGKPVSTASDVYALGVLLYEVLCGHRPFSPARAAARADGTDTGPTPAPSSAVRQTATRTTPDGTEERVTPDDVSGKRRTAPKTLRRTLRGDLDTIVLKAMRVDPGQRYVSAAALADDLERYLAGQPVLACPGSFGYTARKFVRRHRAATLASAALVVTLVAGIVATLAQNRRIREQADRLVVERDRALEVQGFLLESFGSAGADDLAGDSLTVRQVLDARADQVDNLYADDPETRAEMLHVLADGYERLGALEAALTWAERAVAERRRLSTSSPDPELARSVGLLGWILHQRNRLDESEALIRESLAIWRTIEHDSVGLARALNDLAGVLTTQRQLEEAEVAGREAMAIRRAIYPPTHAAIAITANNLGNILASRGDHDAALLLLLESARVLEATLGPRHRRTLFARRNVAVQYAWLGDWERAAAMGKELAGEYEELGGPKDIDLAWTLQAFGAALGRISRTEEADSVLSRGYDIAAERLGDHELTASFLLQKAGLYQRQGRRLDALEQVRAAVALYRRLYDDHPQLAETLRQQGALAMDSEEQLASYRAAAEMLTRLEGEDGPRAVRETLAWARSLVAAGRHADALPLFLTLERTVPVAYGSNHGYAPAPYLGQAEVYAAMGDMDSARRALEQARARMSGAANVPANQQWLQRIEERLSGTP